MIRMRIVTVLLALGLPNGAHAVMTTWTVQSASSSLALSGALSSGGTFMAGIAEQGPGSLTTTYGGMIETAQNLSGGTPTDITITSSQLIANIGGNWDPLLSQAPGTAPANYGLDIGVSFIGGAMIAIRDLVLEMSAASVPLAGTPFAPQSFNATIAANIVSGTAYHRTYGAIGSIWPPPEPMDGPLGDFSASGMIEYGPGGSAGIATLTIPIDATFSILDSGGDTTSTADDIALYLTYTGQIVATAPTASVPEASSLALLGLAGSIVGFVGYQRTRKQMTN